jgi:hypothetical protein
MTDQTAPGPALPQYRQFDERVIAEVVKQALAAAADTGIDPGRVVVAALAVRGFIVATGFTPLDERAIYDQYRSLEWAIRSNLKVRYVMCREIHDNLAAQYSNTRYARPTDLARAYFAGADQSVEAITDAIDFVFSRRVWGDQSFLFGVPIRIDPAARSVMFEFLPDKERD